VSVTLPPVADDFASWLEESVAEARGGISTWGQLGRALHAKRDDKSAADWEADVNRYRRRQVAAPRLALLTVFADIFGVQAHEIPIDRRPASVQVAELTPRLRALTERLDQLVAQVGRGKAGEAPALAALAERLDGLEERLDQMVALVARGAAGQRELLELQPLAEATQAGPPQEAGGGSRP
jgi:hypothetical protein